MAFLELHCPGFIAYALPCSSVHKCYLFIYFMYFPPPPTTHVALMRGRFANSPEKRGCAEMEGTIVILKRDSDFHEYLKEGTLAEERGGISPPPKRCMLRHGESLAGNYCAWTCVSSCPPCPQQESLIYLHKQFLSNTPPG